MKLRIIDLINKIANNEELPKKIKYDDVIWDYDYTIGDYINEDKFKALIESLFWGNITHSFINDEVEIIEEEPKPITKESIEALGYACCEIRKRFENGWNKSLENKPLIEEDKKIEKLNNNRYIGTDISIIDDMFDKINELIDEVNKLKEK